MTQWLLPLYKWIGVSHPIASLVGISLLGGLIFGGMWYLTGRDYQESLAKNQQISSQSGGQAKTNNATIEPQQQERLAIISQLVEDYTKEHKQKMPTFRWLNKRLEEQGRDF